jgi:prepilin signal peptidase PulO-like enzyme (type II secretory pathway)
VTAIPSLALAAYLVLVALIVGSFINLVADRVPRRESIVHPRSHCRSCGRLLNSVDLLPVLGYLVRGGRCATCRAPIGLSSPLVEAAAGACMILALTVSGFWPGALLGFALLAAMGAALVAFAYSTGRPR